MEMMKIHPELSPFQQALLRGLREGGLEERDLERIRSEGASLTLMAAERFFRASAREESYRYAVRLIDTLLSFHLTAHSGDAVAELKHGTLTNMVKACVGELRTLNQLPTVSLLPRKGADIDIVDLLVENVRKLRPTQRILATIGEEIRQRKAIDNEITLAEFFIRAVGGKLSDFRHEQCGDINHAQLMAIIYKLGTGPYLTLAILKKVAKLKRPTLTDVAQKLHVHLVNIPPELHTAYNRVAEGFLESKDVKAFFGKNASVSVFTNRFSTVYYAERSAKAFESIFEEEEED